MRTQKEKHEKAGRATTKQSMAPVFDTWSLREGVRIERKQEVLVSSLAPMIGALWGKVYN